MNAPLHVLYSFPHVLDRPGIAVTALNQIRGIVGAGHRVTLFCAAVGTAELPAMVTVHATMVFAGQRLPHRALGVQRAYGFHDAQVAHWLRSAAGRTVDLVHVWPRGCLRTLAAARAVGIPALRESPSPHTASSLRETARACADAGVPVPPNHSHVYNTALIEREEREYALAAAVLVPSDYAARMFETEGYPASRLLRHRYGTDIDEFHGRRSGLPEDRPFRAVFAGRGEAPKGLHVALEAWNRAQPSQAELVIAGAVQPEFALRYSRLLASPGIRQPGFISDMPQLLGSADILLLPSWTEGSALVVLEAQASGCVPLVTEASGAVGTAGSDYLLHPVGDAEILAKQITGLHTDRPFLHRLRRGLEQDRERWSWTRAGEALDACYDTALSWR